MELHLLATVHVLVNQCDYCAVATALAGLLQQWPNSKATCAFSVLNVLNAQNITQWCSSIHNTTCSAVMLYGTNQIFLVPSNTQPPTTRLVDRSGSTGLLPHCLLCVLCRSTAKCIDPPHKN